MKMRSILIALLIGSSFAPVVAHQESKAKQVFKKCVRVAGYTAMTVLPFVVAHDFYTEHVGAYGNFENWEAKLQEYCKDNKSWNWEIKPVRRKRLVRSGVALCLASVVYGVYGLKKELYDPIANYDARAEFEKDFINAVAGDDVAAADEYMKIGVDVNACRNFNWTALMYAISNNNAGLVKKLLDAGADMTLRNDLKKTPYEMAVDRGYAEIAQMIKERQK